MFSMFEKEVAKCVASASSGALAEGDVLAALEIPKESKLGDLALPCFKFARTMRKAPPQIAAELYAGLELPAVIERAEVAGGYLNFFFSREEVAKSSRSSRPGRARAPAANERARARRCA